LHQTRRDRRFAAPRGRVFVFLEHLARPARGGRPGAALTPQRRGPKADPSRADALLIAQLTRDNLRLQSNLDKAYLVIEVQKKLALLLGVATPDDKPGST
jgi:hypothetical protein